jgi:hypothetical protein
MSKPRFHSSFRNMQLSEMIAKEIMEFSNSFDRDRRRAIRSTRRNVPRHLNLSANRVALARDHYGPTFSHFVARCGHNPGSFMHLLLSPTALRVKIRMRPRLGEAPLMIYEVYNKVARARNINISSASLFLRRQAARSELLTANPTIVDSIGRKYTRKKR